jgi:hypothetical protein
MTVAHVASRKVRLRCVTRFELLAAIGLTIAFFTQSAIADPPVSLSTDENSQNASSDVRPDAGIPTSEEHKLPQVTIETRRELERRVNQFVKGVTNIPLSHQESLPLWHDPLCFAVAGLPTDQGVYALGRLGDVARAIGLRVARPGCKYNFIVVFSREPDKLLKQAFHSHPRSFGTGGGITPLKEFIAPQTPRAVRVWHNRSAVTRYGVPIHAEAACASVAVGGIEIPVSCEYENSYFERYDVYAFSLALVVIDTSYPREFKLEQLIDYAAIAGLTELPATLNIGDASSILQLSNQSSDAVPSGLTAWDSAFLRALYHSDQGNTTQRSEIAVQMIHEIVR